MEWTNVIDLSETAEKTQGTDNDFTQSDIINGKLAYTLGWGQFIALDAYPSPLNSHAVSYVGEAGYATLYDETTGYVLNGNVKAYTAVPNKDYPYLVLTEIENIPASTPVILEGAYYNKFAHEITPIDQANALKGTASETQADGTMYVLAKPEGKEVGFYLAEENTVIPAGKAYYQVANPSVKAFFFNGEEETAINSLTPALSEGEGAIYNMAGQKLSKLQKGINIVNGKKVLK